MAELATLHTRFIQNVLAEEAAYALELRTEVDLAGLPDFVRAAARSAAQQRGLGDDVYAITLSPSLAEPFLIYSSRRDLRETLWRSRNARSDHEGEHDNRPVAAEIIALRHEQATLHGVAIYAGYEVMDGMAGKTAAILD